MRSVFLISLLANIVLFLWQYFGHNHQQQLAEVQINPDPKQIFLVSELSPTQLAELQKARMSQSAHEHIATSLNGPELSFVENNAIALNTIPLLNSLNDHAQENPPTSAITEPVTLAKTPETPVYVLPKKTDQTDANNLNNAAWVPEIQKPTPEPSSNAMTPTPSNTFCYEAGPFSSKRAFKKWQQNAHLAIISSQMFTKMDRETGTFLVYFPAADTYEKSQQNKLDLARQGFKDIWIYSEGEDKGNISLGIVQNYQSAVQLQQALAQKGVNALIKKRLRDRPLPVLYAQITLANQWTENVSAIELVNVKSIAQCQLAN